MYEVKSYSVVILDAPYIIKSTEPELDVLKAVNLINDYAREIATKAPRVDKQTLITLASLQVATMLVQKRQLLDKIDQCTAMLIKTIESALPS